MHYDLRGSGLPLLLIMGATGDGGVFERFAGVLADEFTVVTYDRRGNGRSPRPPGWDTTSPEEQADDGAALLDASGLAPAAVFGTSSGGIFVLDMLVGGAERLREEAVADARTTPPSIPSWSSTPIPTSTKRDVPILENSTIGDLVRCYQALEWQEANLVPTAKR